MSSEDQRPEPDDAEDRPATEPDIDTADESSAEGRWADGSGADGPDAPDDSDASENGENEGSEEDAEAAKNPKGDKTGSSKDTEGERRPTRSGHTENFTAADASTTTPAAPTSYCAD